MKGRSDALDLSHEDNAGNVSWIFRNLSEALRTHFGKIKVRFSSSG